MTLFPNSRLVYGKDDALFGAIEQQQGDKPFGAFLDAGTGMHSLRWMATLKNLGMTRFKAITADEEMRRRVQTEADSLNMSDDGDVVIGNWFGNRLPVPVDEKYDTILADYLIGAMDGFSPYKQDQMISMLSSYLNPGGKLYIVGLEPIPDYADGDGNIICKVRQIRDACILLAGHRCYREYPVEWIQRQVTNIPELTLLNTTTFPILYSHQTIVNQINVGRSKFESFPSPELAEEMKKVLDDLERQSLAATSNKKRVKLGFDYVVTAVKAEST
ncbi:unnamed protein product [Cylindrotheca closterium]|uniref:Uncharacterized protein n=1 Tax=Cylindrotheca closterium TaxID=2856 RepID=A0AAD2PW74_9STRA|nr:unnamed protein product [Cylindrotheca closterium]